MMNKNKKKEYIEEMKNFFNDTSSVLVTHYQGLSVNQIDELKSEMRFRKNISRYFIKIYHESLIK